MQQVDFSSWIAGWTALVAVVIFGVFLLLNSYRVARARKRIDHRIMLTGSRGKSGTVRLLHAALTANGEQVYGKITGTAASELLVDGSEVETKRFGPATTCEMNTSLMKAHKLGARFGIFECMAVSPQLVELVTSRMVQPQVVVIPTIRLDHLEEEGLSEREIGLTLLNAVRSTDVVFTSVAQPELRDAFAEFASDHDLDIRFVDTDLTLPEIPGHHPTNVSLSLAIAEHFGVAREDALAAMLSSSREPRAQTFQRIERSDGSELLLVDLGAANDPQSSTEAFRSIGLKRSRVAPVLVNRWERPLRSLTFIAATYARFGTVGVAGTLHTWANRWVSRQNRELHDHGAHTRYIKLSTHQARDPERLWEWTSQVHKLEHRASRTLVLLENIHNPSVDTLRSTFDARAEEISLAELKVKHD